MTYKQIYDNELMDRQVLEEEANRLKAEQENDNNIANSLWNNYYENFALKKEIERLKAQRPSKFQFHA